jgi:hypothetical protein
VEELDTIDDITVRAIAAEERIPVGTIEKALTIVNKFPTAD